MCCTYLLKRRWLWPILKLLLYYLLFNFIMQLLFCVSKNPDICTKHNHALHIKRKPNFSVAHLEPQNTQPSIVSNIKILYWVMFLFWPTIFGLVYRVQTPACREHNNQTKVKSQAINVKEPQPTMSLPVVIKVHQTLIAMPVIFLQWAH